jgi:hypothetical protein
MRPPIRVLSERDRKALIAIHEILAYLARELDSLEQPQSDLMHAIARVQSLVKFRLPRGARGEFVTRTCAAEAPARKN